EISGYSVVRTAREWMLNARRANRAETRVSTPGLFSTRTERVCRVIAPAPSLVTVERRADAAGVLDIVIAHTRGNHGPDHVVPADREVPDHGPVVDLLGLADRLVHIGHRFTSQPHTAAGLGELDEIGNTRRLVSGVQVRAGIALVEEQRLPLAHHAQRG